MKLSIIGTGYVGLVTAVGFATHNHKIICVDIDEDKIEQINQGQSPIFENGLENLLQKYKNNIEATTKLSEAIDHSEITFICVGTPSKKDGSIDLTAITNIICQLGTELQHKNKYHLIVIKSTVIPGTTQQIILPLLEQKSNKQLGKGFGLAMNPEFLREGTALKDFFNPDRIIIGSVDDHSAQILQELYHDFNVPIQCTSPSTAEMIKYASNAFLATKISFINEIGNLCKHLNVDTYKVADGMGFDNRIGRAFLNAGIGWGGSCFPKDLNALRVWAQKEQLNTLILDNVVTVNEKQPLQLIRILKKHVPILANKTIGLLGLAFKPNTDDIRESRAIPIVQQLINEGATIKAYDPQAMHHFAQLYPQITYCDSATPVLNTDAILILTKWDEFSHLNYKGKIVIDGRRLETAKNASIYEGVCW